MSHTGHFPLSTFNWISLSGVDMQHPDENISTDFFQICHVTAGHVTRWLKGANYSDNIIQLFRVCLFMQRINYHIFMNDLSLRLADAAPWKKMQLNLSTLRLISDLLPYTEDNEGNTNEFLRKFVEMLLEYMKTTFDRSSKILDFHHPEQLLEILDLTLPNEPQNLDQLLADCRDTLKYQVKTG